MALCSLVGCYQHFSGICCFCFQKNVNELLYLGTKSTMFFIEFYYGDEIREEGMDVSCSPMEGGEKCTKD